MALLFTDTTYDITVGVLSDEFEWLELRTHTGQKASAVLQKETHDVCKAVGVKPRDLKGIVTCAGPGFYTGLRLSEGFADIFKIFEIPSFAFYSFEVPKLTGIAAGAWMTKAYRGEYFFYEWDERSSESFLVAAKDLDATLEKYDHVYLHSLGAVDRELPKCTLTLDLLRERPQTLFREIVRANLQRESYYFRAPEDEFRVSV